MVLGYGKSIKECIKPNQIIWMEDWKRTGLFKAGSRSWMNEWDILVRVTEELGHSRWVLGICCSLFSRLDVSDSFATPRAVDCQDLLSVGFPRQEFWSGLLFPSLSICWAFGKRQMVWAAQWKEFGLTDPCSPTF